MDLTPPSLWSFLQHIEEPRHEGRNRRHLLKDIIILGVVGFACGMKSFEAIAEFASMQESWFRGMLKLPHGVPSHDTFERVFQMLEADELERRFIEWTSALTQHKPGDVVPIDGKTIRNSGSDLERAVHLVSAWGHSNGLVLGQLSCDEKSNEITAIPELLDLLAIEGCIVTIDAMGCQKDIAAAILSRGAGYILHIKDNQPTLYNAVQTLFASLGKRGLEDVPGSYHEETTRKHGRVEVRRCFTTGFVDWLDDIAEWPGLLSFACVEYERTVDGVTSIERRYYMSTEPGDDAAKILSSVRAHWGIENKLHWILDVTLGEDQARLRDRQLAENASVLRRLALNALRLHPDYAGSPAKAMRRAAFDLEFRKTLVKSISSNA